MANFAVFKQSLSIYEPETQKGFEAQHSRWSGKQRDASGGRESRPMCHRAG